MKVIYCILQLIVLLYNVLWCKFLVKGVSNMLNDWKFKIRRLFLISTFFVLLISLSACTSAGYPVGKLDTEEVYARAGNFTVTKGELWNELRWSASDVLNDKIEEVVIKDSFKKVELIMRKNFLVMILH